MWHLEIFGSLNSLNEMKHDAVIMIVFHPIVIIIIFISNNIASKLYEIKKDHFLMLLLKTYVYIGRTKWVYV
jgi:hypothetical protein